MNTQKDTYSLEFRCDNCFKRFTKTFKKGLE